MDFGNRLRTLRLEKAITHKVLSECLGVSIGTISNWERGIRVPSMEYIVPLSKALDVSCSTLLGEDESDELNNSCCYLSKSESTLIHMYRELDLYGKELLKTACSVELQRVKYQSKAEVRPKVIKTIPLYSLPASAGTSAPLDIFDFEMYQVTDDVPYDADYAVRIQGISMEPIIQDDSIVYVRRITELNNGDIGIFNVDGSMYCKQFYKSQDGSVTLVSYNEEKANTNVFLPPDSGSTLMVYGRVLIGQRPKLPDYFLSGLQHFTC